MEGRRSEGEGRKREREVLLKTISSTSTVVPKKVVSKIFLSTCPKNEREGMEGREIDRKKE